MEQNYSATHNEADAHYWRTRMNEPLGFSVFILDAVVLNALYVMLSPPEAVSFVFLMIK